MAAPTLIPNEQRTGSMQCPKCQSDIEEHPNYMSWCECGWNLTPYQPDDKPSRFAAIYERFGHRMGKRLLHDMAIIDNLRPKPSAARVFTLLFAASIHLVTLGCLILCLYFFMHGYWLLALPFLLILWLQFPRIPRLSMQEKSDIVSREQFPTLYAIMDEAADRLKLPRVDGIILNESYNALYQQAGISLKRYVTLGLPLFSVLDPAEKVALIGHELGHGVNGDFTRALFIRSAFDTLVRWYGLLYPEEGLPRRASYTQLLIHLANFIMKLLSYIPLLLVMLFIHAIYYDSQKAEYMADYLGAKVGGTVGALGLSSKLFCYSTYELVRQRHSIHQLKGNFFDALKAAAHAIPPREYERIRRVGMLEGSTLNCTHPPTAYRIHILQQHEHAASEAMQLSFSQLEQLDHELRAVEPRLQERVLQEYQRSLYF